MLQTGLVENRFQPKPVSHYPTLFENRFQIQFLIEIQKRPYLEAQGVLEALEAFTRQQK